MSTLEARGGPNKRTTGSGERPRTDVLIPGDCGDNSGSAGRLAPARDGKRGEHAEKRRSQAVPGQRVLEMPIRQLEAGHAAPGPPPGRTRLELGVDDEGDDAGLVAGHCGRGHCGNIAPIPDVLAGIVRGREAAGRLRLAREPDDLDLAGGLTLAALCRIL